MKILLVEDNLSIRNVLKMSLEADLFTVDLAEDGERGSYYARINQYDLIILDNILPQKSGKQVCQEIREQKIMTPILMLSAKSDILSKVDLLNSGADDYMTKPFSFEELRARIRTLIRRPNKIEDIILRVGPFILNQNSYEMTKNGKRIYLTKKEFSLLSLLMQNLGKVTTRSTIMESVWDINSDPFSNTIETHIRNLRKKLGDDRKKFIKNIPGCGYKMCA